MRKLAPISVLIAGACGLLLTAGGTCYADGFGESGDYGADGVTKSDTSVRVHSACSNREASCLNGALNSANLNNAQNIWMKGNNNSSGGGNNDNGNANTHNESHSVSAKTDNDLQAVAHSPGQHL